MQLPTFAEPEQPETDPKRRFICRHIFTEGHRCGSPALRGQSLCFYHGRSRRMGAASGHSRIFAMPRIDDRATIQLALYEVLARLASGDIEYKRGSIILYGLQIASSNLPRHNQPKVEAQPQVEEVTYDSELGDLAPIAEILVQAHPTSVILSEARSAESKDPDAPQFASTLHTILPPHPITLATAPAAAAHPTSVILSEARSAESKDPDAPQFASTLHTILPPHPITLATVHAVAAHPTSVILREARSAESKDPDAPQFASTLHTILPPHPITLATVHAVAAHPTSVILREARRISVVVVKPPPTAGIGNPQPGQ